MRNFKIFFENFLMRIFWRWRSRRALEGQWSTRSHPHRQLLAETIVGLRPDSVLEIGCGAGANLMALKTTLPEVRLEGVDISGRALDYLRRIHPAIKTKKIKRIERLPYGDGEIDVVLTDATLIYVPPWRLEESIVELARVARRAIVLCEWNTPDRETHVRFGHWAHDFKGLLRMNKTFFSKIEHHKITKETWPDSSRWQEMGYIYVCHL